MSRNCRVCAAVGQDHDRFCRTCGAELPGASELVAAGERRHLTVMFCDLVGSTQLSGRLDPEDLRELVLQYQQQATSSITRFGGRVANYLGDGILAYFGYPTAGDHDPRRAVQAGLDIVQRIVDLADPRVAARVAVHTGHVLVAPMGSLDTWHRGDVVGLAANIAARLQDCADTNTVIISEATAALVDGFFTLTPLGPVDLKGVPGPVNAFRPERAHDHVTRFDLARARGLTPFTGRDDEQAWLNGLWRQACAGERTTAVITGPPGLGKTRLVHELLHRPALGLHEAVELQCSSLHTGSPLHPVVQCLHDRLHRSTDGTGEEVTGEALRRLVVDAGLEPQPAVALLGELLGVEHDPTEALPEGVELRRAMTMDVVRRVLVNESAPTPLVLVVEDLQWADPTTLELIGSITSSGPGRGVLVIGTARPELVPPWPDDPRVVTRDLPPLDEGSSRRLVECLTVGCDLPAADVQEIVDRADGVPFFIEELTRLLLHEPTGPDDRASDHLPPTLQDLLVGRIDREPQLKPLLQVAAVVGREFDLDLVAAAGGEALAVDDTTPVSMLASDLVVEVAGSTTPFAFRHALLRDAAYSTLLHRTRAELHANLARQLLRAAEDGEPKHLILPPHVVAYHCERGHLSREAIGCYQQAAQASMGSGANAEALALLDRATALLDGLADDPDRDGVELELLAQRGPALMASFGFAHSLVEDTFARAGQLCDVLGDPPQIFPVLYGLAGFHSVRAELELAGGFADRLLSQGRASGDRGMTTLGHAAQAQTLFLGGRFADAYEHATHCAADHDPFEHPEHLLMFGEDPGTVCSGVRAWLLWMLGRPGAAAEAADAAVELARSLQHRFTLAELLLVAAHTYHYLGDLDRLRSVVDEAMELSEVHGFPLFAAEASIWSGWLDAMQGSSAGPARMRAGVDAFRASGAEVFAPFHLTLLGEASAATGDHHGARAALDEARAVEEATGARAHAAERARLQAVALAQHSPRSGEWVAALDEAAAIAEAQRAVSFALRVATTRLELALSHVDLDLVETSAAALARVCADLPPGEPSAERRRANDLLNTCQSSIRRGPDGSGTDHGGDSDQDLP